MARESNTRRVREFSEENDSIWRIAFSPLIWIVQFVLVYGATSLVCVRLGADPQLVHHLRTGIGIATGLSIAGIVWIGFHSWKQWNREASQPDAEANEGRHQFLGHASFLLSVISLLGVLFLGLPALILPGCG